MEEKSILISYYNSFFDNHPDFKLIQRFVIKDDLHFTGQIRSLTSKLPLEINVYIPLNFPFQKINFTTSSILGYPHLSYRENGQHEYCLNTPFVESIEGRLELEISRLNNWIKIYLNEGRQDRHYDYLIFPVNCCETLFFSEQSQGYFSDRFADNYFGEFELFQVSISTGNNKHWFFANNLANIDSGWSPFIKSISKKEKGYWLFVDNEPVKKDKTAYSTWTELCDNVFSHDFKTYITKMIRMDYMEFRKTAMKKSTGKKQNFNTKNIAFSLPLALGYKIPSEGGGQEVHWEFAFLFHSEGRKLEKISWANSKNICAERYFGRGGFCQNLRTKKICIIGLGAVGSSLCEILARGGVNYLDISDGDYVDTGNICRSIYDLSDYDDSKANQLRNKLSLISPFIEINVIDGFIYGQPQFSPDYEKTKQRLEAYDIVFDCSANNELLHFLSNLEVSTTIVSISISNKAKEMFCHTNTNQNSIFDSRRIAAYSFGKIEEPDYFEGAGCFMPTFEASFFDINALLNLALRHIDKSFSSKGVIDSFHLAYKAEGVEITDYRVFYQKELGFVLTVFSNCEEDIYNFARAYYPYEFGGVLIGGYSDNGKQIYLTDVLIPDKFSNSRFSFKGDTKKINKVIKQYYDQSNGNIIYLGDWHSHPNNSNSYSSLDYRAIKNQARSSTVSINNPLMAIISIGREGYEIGYYIYYEGRLYKFSQ